MHQESDDEVNSDKDPEEYGEQSVAEVIGKIQKSFETL